MGRIIIADISTRRTHQGALECSALINGDSYWGAYYVTRQYMGYPKRDALRLFRDGVNAGDIR